MNQEYFNLLSIILIVLNLISTVGISLIGFSKTKKLQILVEKETSNREIFQREYDLRKDAVRNSEEKSVTLFKKIDELIELLKLKKIDEADSKLKTDMYKYYWDNILFFPNELQVIYKKITDFAIEVVVDIPTKKKDYYEHIQKMNDLYFEYIQIFRDIYYYDNPNISKIAKEQLRLTMSEIKESEKRITIPST